MAKYTVLITKNSSGATDITSLVEQFHWKGRKGSSGRSVTVKILDDDGYHHARSGIDVEEGYNCLITCNGNEIFRGIIMKTNQRDNKIMSFVAYDNGIYFANNKDTFCYTNMTASEIFKDVCNRFGFEIGTVAKTYYKIPELIKKRTTGWDVICDAMSLEYDATGVRHYVTSSMGKVSMTTRRETILQWVLEVDRNITSYNYEKSIEDVRTRIRLLSDEGTVLAESRNATLEKKIGIMQDVDVLDETLTDAQLKELCKTILGEISTPSRTLDLEALGIPDVYSGVGVFVIIPHLGLSRTFYVDQDTHTFKGNKHTMSLKLTLATDIEDYAGGGGGGTQEVYTSLRAMFQGSLAIDSEILQGTVISTSPLKIQMENDSKLVITGTSTIVPKHLTNYSVGCSIGYSGEGGVTISTKGAGDPYHTHEVEPFTLSGTAHFYNALKVGDKVHLIALQSGKKYYVLDRV